MYRLSGNIQLAEIGDQLIDTTDPGIAQFYKFPINDYVDIDITKTLYNSRDISSLAVFISLNPEN